MLVAIGSLAADAEVTFTLGEKRYALWPIGRAADTRKSRCTLPTFWSRSDRPSDAYRRAQSLAREVRSTAIGVEGGRP
jgi:hypothetical protein